MYAYSLLRSFLSLKAKVGSSRFFPFAGTHLLHYVSFFFFFLVYCYYYFFFLFFNVASQNSYSTVYEWI